MSSKNRLLNSKNYLPQVIVLGNSHTLFGLKPKAMSKRTINLANKSRKIETDFYILKKNISKLTELETIILPISFYTLFTNELSEQEKRLYYNFYKIEEYNQGWFKNSLLLNEPFRELVNDVFFSKHKTIISEKGWRANKSYYKFDKVITSERIGDIDERFSRKQVIHENIKYLKKIITLCKKENVKLVILLPPYHPDFYKFTNSQYDIKIKSLLNEINLKSCLFIDSKKLNINKDKYYENVDHLNELGAIVFSKKVDSIVNF